MNKPTISVIMSVYNETISSINEAVNSILMQKFTDLEFIIVNDSPSRVDVQRYLKKLSLTDDRVILIKNNRNSGLVSSLNNGLKVARGRFIARMDADDVSCLHRLDVEMDIIRRGYDFVGTSAREIDTKNITVGKRIMPIEGDISSAQQIRTNNFIIHSSTLIRKSSLDFLDGYRQIPSCEDYDLWSRLLLSGFTGYVTKKILLDYRIRDSGVTSSNKLLMDVSASIVRQGILKCNTLEKYDKLVNPKEIGMKYNKFPLRSSLFRHAYNTGSNKYEDCSRTFKNNHSFKAAIALISTLILYPLNIKKIFFALRVRVEKISPKRKNKEL
ncbi:hypothetical protein AYR62_03000 [Secundilactobacillus paracollinoides]|uniref:Glycosyltransferase 2-like domain-containing protein n=2 Tax=Secundilactobacillus paracollinoides TaxID=240427 RepID=A0A1B2IUG2_9LACO|nr:glycosyltransferase [Secundilactobacillus paracollinoides]ANZ59903.1 hypothetical protein AYR61_00055 [Secundilactobacillus paracollinoides]ANZ63164.1 hypothetical protein AYR62_03000 [Secundilactobacillus paracollinoides]ANZ65694.1 hypothetical protein AYR63_00060 [Secundilactobacillus paracollinoides]